MDVWYDTNTGNRHRVLYIAILQRKRSLFAIIWCIVMSKVDTTHGEDTLSPVQFAISIAPNQAIMINTAQNEHTKRNINICQTHELEELNQHIEAQCVALGHTNMPTCLWKILAACHHCALRLFAFKLNVVAVRVHSCLSVMFLDFALLISLVDAAIL